MSKTSLDKSKIKFLLLEGIHPSAVEVLKNAGYTNVETLPGALQGDELKEKIADAHFVGLRSRTQLNAELVLAEAILLLRGIPEKNAAAHRGGWMKSATNSYEARGKTLGIVGYGSIGSQLSVLAESLGMNVLFYDVVAKLPLGNAQQVGNLHDLLGQCDIVSLHVPDLPSTRWMIRA